MKQTCKELMKQRVTGYKWATKRNDICIYSLQCSRACKLKHLPTRIHPNTHIYRALAYLLIVLLLNE